MSTNKYIDDIRRQFLRGIGVPQQAAFVADDFQKEAISSVVDGQDTLVVAPTGAGKTYIAMEAIQATLALGLRAVYTTPLKALSNTKFAELKSKFAPRHKVGLLTGDRKIDGDADVVVATTEIYRNELYRSQDRYGLVILDEVHFISDQQRGPVWEESIILTPSSSTLLMLSASISNYAEISEWIQSVRQRTCHVVIKRERPVELRYGFLHPEFGPMPLADSRGNIIREVQQFYGSLSLDASGMRLRGRGRDGRSFERRGRRGKRSRFGRGR
ncbi:MAG: DEAD/DEAH box helicase [Oligoflexia bacterium]|nr:DEAD/DEAH box helicase [Oligoflexia bacterium]